MLACARAVPALLKSALHHSEAHAVNLGITCQSSSISRKPVLHAHFIDCVSACVCELASLVVCWYAVMFPSVTGCQSHVSASDCDDAMMPNALFCSALSDMFAAACVSVQAAVLWMCLLDGADICTESRRHGCDEGGVEQRIIIHRKPTVTT